MKKYLIIQVLACGRDNYRKKPLYITDADGIVPFEGLSYDIYEILEGGMLKQIQDGER